MPRTSPACFKCFIGLSVCHIHHLLLRMILVTLFAGDVIGMPIGVNIVFHHNLYAALLQRDDNHLLITLSVLWCLPGRED